MHNDFIEILNLLLDRISIHPFLFTLPKNTILFSKSNYSPIFLKQIKNKNLALFKNIDSLWKWILENKDITEQDIEFLKEQNSKNKKFEFVLSEFKDNDEARSVCLNSTKENLSLFNCIKFREFYIEKINNITEEDALIYVGIKDGKLQTSYKLSELEYFVILTKDKNLYLTDSRLEDKNAFLFDTILSFKNYHTSGEIFRWIEILFYYENKIRNIFNKVQLNSKYITSVQDFKQLKYIIDGEKKYTPIEGYIEYTGISQLIDERKFANDYLNIENIKNLPLINIIHYEKYVNVKKIFYNNNKTNINIIRDCKKNDYRLNCKFNCENINNCFMDNIFPFLK